MALRWIRESFARWDADKARIVGEAPPGTFAGNYRTLRDGAMVPGEWWRVEDDGRVVGYGWIDVVWGDAEILLAVDPSARRHGIGSFVLTQLQSEAGRRGLHCLYNVVPLDHPRREEVTRWLQARGYREDMGRLLRTVVRAA
jgi:ribosomal protein S18 acetylase RimI-like enzyme